MPQIPERLCSSLHILTGCHLFHYSSKAQQTSSKLPNSQVGGYQTATSYPSDCCLNTSLAYDPSARIREMSVTSVRSSVVWRQIRTPPPYPTSHGGLQGGSPVSRGLTRPSRSWGYGCWDLVLQVRWVSNETVTYGYGCFATLTSEWCALQNTDQHSRQRGRPTWRSEYMSD
jgi:hypothetical protein